MRTGYEGGLWGSEGFTQEERERWQQGRDADVVKRLDPEWVELAKKRAPANWQREYARLLLELAVDKEGYLDISKELWLEKIKPVVEHHYPNWRIEKLYQK